MLTKEKLILDNINLIYMVLKKYNLYNQLDEYYDIGMIGLVKGANTYSGDKGYKASTYLTSCITNEILAYKRKQSMQKRGNGKQDISIYTQINDNGKELYLLDIIPSKENIEDNIIKKERLELIYKEIFKLSERDKLIICSTYGLLGYKELTQIQISKKTNITQAQVSRIIKKFIKECKEKYNGGNKNEPK